MSFRFGAMIRLVDLRFQASIVDDVISVRGNDSTRGPTVSSLLRRWRFGATYRPETKKTKQFNSSINPLINLVKQLISQLINVLFFVSLSMRTTDAQTSTINPKTHQPID